MTKPRLKYGNGTWSANCPAGAWGVGTTPEEAYRRWSGIARSMRDKALRDIPPSPTIGRIKAMLEQQTKRSTQPAA